MSSIAQADRLVESAVESLDGELSGAPDPKLANIPKVQKEVFRQRLENIHDNLKSGTVPEKSQRDLGLSRAIADGWPFDSKLGEEIVRAERAYIEEK